MNMLTYDLDIIEPENSIYTLICLKEKVQNLVFYFYWLNGVI